MFNLSRSHSQYVARLDLNLVSQAVKPLPLTIMLDRLMCSSLRP